MAKPNWNKIKHEYITTEIAMRPLANKHGVSFNTLRNHAVSEKWALAREQYQSSVADIATKKLRKQATKEATKVADEAALILEGATLAINWIVKRLNSDEVSDWREVEGLLRALNGAKALTKIKMGLDNEEQRARIDNLKKSTEIAGREPVQIEFVNTEDTPK